MKRQWFALALSSLFSSSPLLSQSLDSLTRPLEGRSARVTSSHKLDNGEIDPNSNWDNSNIKPGSIKVMADLQGPGEITHLWMTFLGPEPQGWAPNGAANHQEMVLRIFYDGRSKPDVESPVGEFFGCGFEKRMELKSLPVIVDDGDSYNCFWRMPFRQSCRIEVENQSDKDVALFYYNVDWIQKPVPEDSLYFCAQYNQSYPVLPGQDYLVLDAQGKGHTVGTTLFVRSRSPEWFGEGDEKIYVDGEEKPSIWGTGTEDYFLAAWGLQENSTPYFGTPWAEAWGILGQKTAAYRWHIQDPLVFQKGLRVTFEHYGWLPVDENPQGKRDSWNEREDDFASVAYWYQAGPTQAFTTLPSCQNRKLPSLDITIPASPLVESHGKGELVTQTGGLWPASGQVFFKPADTDQGWIEIPFEVKVREPRRLILNMTRSYDYGIYQVHLDGVKIGEPLDLYNETTETHEFHLMDFWPEEGKHMLRIKLVGQSDRSKGNYVGIVSILLRERRPRVTTYGYDKEKDWRKEPVLY